MNTLEGQLRENIDLYSYVRELKRRDLLAKIYINTVVEK